MRGLVLGLLLAGCAHRYGGPIIDFHAHLEPRGAEGRINPNVAATPDELLRRMDARGIGKAVLVTIAPKGDLERTRRQNDEVIAVAKQRPDRFVAAGSVHPDDGHDALAELARLARSGVKVVKLHPDTQRFDVGSPRLAELVARAAELQMVVLIDAWSPFDPGQVGKLIELAITHPAARLVLAHLGGARFHEMIGFWALNQYPWYARNVWFDLSAVTRMYADSPAYREQLAFVCRQIGVDRILFGSDFPQVMPEQAVADVERLGFGHDELRRIFHENAVRLLEWR